MSDSRGLRERPVAPPQRDLATSTDSLCNMPFIFLFMSGHLETKWRLGTRTPAWCLSPPREQQALILFGKGDVFRVDAPVFSAVSMGRSVIYSLPLF